MEEGVRWECSVAYCDLQCKLVRYRPHIQYRVVLSLVVGARGYRCTKRSRVMRGPCSDRCKGKSILFDWMPAIH